MEGEQGGLRREPETEGGQAAGEFLPGGQTRENKDAHRLQVCVHLCVAVRGQPQVSFPTQSTLIF